MVKKSLIYQLGQIRLPYLCLATFLLAVFLSSCWYFWFYQDLCIAELQCEVRVHALEQRRLLLPDVQYQVTLLKQKNDTVSQELRNKFHAFQPLNFNQQRDLLLANLEESGLGVVAFNPRVIKKKVFYDKNVIEFKTVGTFDQMTHFLRKASAVNVPARFKKVVIIRKERSLVLESVLAFYTFEKEK